MKNIKVVYVILCLGAFSILYGYLCRIADFYFFWESKIIGWEVFLIGIALLLYQRIISKEVNKKTTIEKIGLGVVVFIFIIQTILTVVIINSDAYTTAKKYLTTNASLNKEIGKVVALSIIPTGSIQQTTDSEGEQGDAAISLIVKGEKKFKDVVIYVTKQPNSSDWKVEAVE